MLRRPIIALLALVLVLGGCGHTTGAPTDNTIHCSAQLDEVPGSSEDFIKHVGDRVLFETDMSALDHEAKRRLDRQFAWLRFFKNTHLIIEGHADERGTREYNLALGERRANAVRNYLIGRDIAASRIKTISYGKERPEVAGSDEFAWARNRRTVSTVQE